jgi:PAS domain S-box-containing protein
MEEKIAVIIVEDSTDDSELIEMTLRNSGMEVTAERVDSREDLVRVLGEKEWDIVISDYNLPGFGGLEALSIVRQTGNGIPFILISGKIGEEKAVEAVLAGANDYVMKDNLTRLLTVVKREIGNAAIRRARLDAELALEESEHRFRMIFENSHEGILLTDGNGLILAVNSPACTLLQYDRDELLRAQMQDVLALTGPEGSFIEGRIRSGQYKGELTLARKDGSTFPAELTAVRFSDRQNNDRCSLFIRDITTRKKNEQQLRASLREKDVLLAEVHHRVKNNLAIISGLLELQAGNIENQETRDLLSESIHRIKAIALLHEKVYKSDDLSRINLGEYLNEFIGTLRSYYLQNGEKIEVSIKIPETYVNLSSAIPLGLIVNELITNAFRHAFKGRDQGRILVSLQQSGPKKSLTIQDNGTGLPDDVYTGKTRKLGMTLVHGMVTQLKAQLEIKRNNGTGFTIIF